MKRFERHRIRLDDRRSVDLDVLRDGGEADRRDVAGLEQQGSTTAEDPRVVDVLGLVRSEYVSEKVRRAVPDRVDETCILAIESGRSERDRVAERSVDHGVRRVADATVVHAFNADAAARHETFCRRQVRNEAKYTA